MTTSWAIPVDRQSKGPDSGVMLSVMLGFIAAVSMYDMWLTYRLRDVILGTEENPICLWLIRLEPSALGVFLPAKILGTVFVVGFCALLYRWFKRHAMAIAAGVAVFQSWLLCYLQM